MNINGFNFGVQSGRSTVMRVVDVKREPDYKLKRPMPKNDDNAAKKRKVVDSRQEALSWIRSLGKNGLALHKSKVEPGTSGVGSGLKKVEDPLKGGLKKSYKIPKRVVNDPEKPNRSSTDDAQRSSTDDASSKVSHRSSIDEAGSKASHRSSIDDAGSKKGYWSSFEDVSKQGHRPSIDGQGHRSSTDEASSLKKPHTASTAEASTSKKAHRPSTDDGSKKGYWSSFDNKCKQGHRSSTDGHGSDRGHRLSTDGHGSDRGHRSSTDGHGSERGHRSSTDDAIASKNLAKMIHTSPKRADDASTTKKLAKMIHTSPKRSGDASASKKLAKMIHTSPKRSGDASAPKKLAKMIHTSPKRRNSSHWSSTGGARSANAHRTSKDEASSSDKARNSSTGHASSSRRTHESSKDGKSRRSSKDDGKARRSSKDDGKSHRSSRDDVGSSDKARKSSSDHASSLKHTHRSSQDDGKSHWSSTDDPSFKNPRKSSKDDPQPPQKAHTSKLVNIDMFSSKEIPERKKSASKKKGSTSKSSLKKDNNTPEQSKTATEDEVSPLPRTRSGKSANSSVRDSGISISEEASSGTESTEESEPELIIKKKRRKPLQLYKCEICDKGFQTSTDLRRHLLIHSDEKPFKCELCNKSYRQEINLKNHKQIVHTGTKEFICRFCLRPFSIKQRLKVHIRVHTDDKPYSCPHCPKTFALGEERQQHMATDHKLGKAITCEKCLSTFTSEHLFQVHMQRHRDMERNRAPKRHICGICQKICVSSKAVRVHMSVDHPKVKNFDCPICKVMIKVELETHMKTHAIRRDYQCDICQAVFAQRTQCIIHKRTHTGERPYQCRVCWRRFGHTGVLKLHIRKHTGEKPFKCVICQEANVAFSQLSHLKTHMQKIHNTDHAYACDACKACFKMKFHLDNHIKICEKLDTGIKTEEDPEVVKAAAKKVENLARLRYLMAVLIKKISSEEKLVQLGYEKRLIDNVLIAALKVAKRKCFDSKKIPELDRMRLNIHEFLEWIVPDQVMDGFKRECPTIESILEKIVDMYLQEKEKEINAAPRVHSTTNLDY